MREAGYAGYLRCGFARATHAAPVILAHMEAMELHEFHQALNAAFTEVYGVETVSSYGDPLAEHSALWNTAGVLDLSYRGRICLTGDDRVRFLNGQVTNNIKSLQPGQGCYAALTTAKGKMESDLHIHCLKDELLIDFEPGLTAKVIARLEKYIVSDDVEVVDLKPHYGLLSIQGPRAREVFRQLELSATLPEILYQSVTVNDPGIGEFVLVNLPRYGSQGFDLFIPMAALGSVAERLMSCREDRGRLRLWLGSRRYGSN